jgi:glycosyltransferase involved in cell wall biosynthesis
VVVAAHTRVEFLKRAVASAADQAPDEIIVVKFTHDEALDRELAQLGATVLWTQEPFQGGKYSVGIERATGDVVVALDDDDVFLPGKIARVRSIFEDPAVVCYTNRYLPFTDSPPPAGEPSPVRRFETTQGNQYRNGLKPVLMSCLAVRRATVLPWLEDLRHLTIADHTIFMIAIAQRKVIAMDQSILTGYRVARVEGELRPAQSIWNRPGASAARDLKWMLDLLDSTTDGVRDTLNPMVANAVIHLVFLTGDTHFREYRRAMRAILHGVGIRRPLVVPSTLMFVYPVSPKLALSLYRTWKSLVGFHHHQG